MAHMIRGNSPFSLLFGRCGTGSGLLRALISTAPNGLAFILEADTRVGALIDRDGEGFRAPAITGRAEGHGAGVRKPPKHEPAGCDESLWRFRALMARDESGAGVAMLSAGRW